MLRSRKAGSYLHTTASRCRHPPVAVSHLPNPNLDWEIKSVSKLTQKLSRRFVRRGGTESVFGPTRTTCAVHQSRQLCGVHRTCRRRSRKDSLCEGFQTPAVTKIPQPRRPASGNLQGTKPRGGARVRRCPRACYGDLGVGGPQLRSAGRVG